MTGKCSHRFRSACYLEVQAARFSRPMEATPCKKRRDGDYRSTRPAIVESKRAIRGWQQSSDRLSLRVVTVLEDRFCAAVHKLLPKNKKNKSAYRVYSVLAKNRPRRPSQHRHSNWVEKLYLLRLRTLMHSRVWMSIDKNQAHRKRRIGTEILSNSLLRGPTVILVKYNLGGGRRESALRPEFQILRLPAGSSARRFISTIRQRSSSGSKTCASSDLYLTREAWLVRRSFTERPSMQIATLHDCRVRMRRNETQFAHEFNAALYGWEQNYVFLKSCLVRYFSLRQRTSSLRSPDCASLNQIAESLLGFPRVLVSPDCSIANIIIRNARLSYRFSRAAGPGLRSTISLRLSSRSVRSLLLKGERRLVDRVLSSSGRSRTGVASA